MEENIDIDIANKALKFMSNCREECMDILNSELCMPNIPMPTLGGHTFWITLTSWKGYKLQQNQITNHARILDSKDVRIAWGNVNGMRMTLERMAQMADQYEGR